MSNGLTSAAFLPVVHQSPVWGSEQVGLQALRAQAWQVLSLQGLPTRAHEEWKYTDWQRLLPKVMLMPVVAHALAEITQVTIAAQRLAGCDVLVLVDGVFAPTLSDQPAGVHVRSLRQVWQQSQERVLSVLQREQTWAQSPMLALNTALASDGLWLEVAEGVQVARPVQVIALSTSTFPLSSRGLTAEPTSQGNLCNLRHTLHLGAGSALTLVDDVQASESTLSMINAVWQGDIGPGASLDYYRVQQSGGESVHVSDMRLTQRRNSRVQLFYAGTSGKIGRYDAQVNLAEEGAQCHINGFYRLQGREHFDVHTTVVHAASHTESHEWIKGVADAQSHGVFNGKVIVRPGIAGVVARQSNPNLLLSAQAEIDSKPELQIDSDAVQCSHGASVGQLDREALFYLQSRGIALADAREMLLGGFLVECWEVVKVPALREWGVLHISPSWCN